MTEPIRQAFDKWYDHPDQRMHLEEYYTIQGRYLEAFKAGWHAAMTEERQRDDTREQS